MNNIWKVLIGLNAVISCLSLLYLYALLSANPYDKTYYKIEQLKMDIRKLDTQADDLRKEFEAFSAHVSLPKTGEMK